MTLHDRIMGLPKRTPGQHDVVVEAALMASEADELMAEQHDVIKAFYVWAQEEGTTAAAKLIDGVLAKYNAYKEQSNEQ